MFERSSVSFFRTTACQQAEAHHTTLCPDFASSNYLAGLRYSLGIQFANIYDNPKPGSV